MLQTRIDTELLKEFRILTIKNNHKVQNVITNYLKDYIKRYKNDNNKR